MHRNKKHQLDGVFCLLYNVIVRKITQKLKNHFIPHEDNNHEPHFFRHKSLTIILVLIIVLELGFLFDVFVILKKDYFLASVLPGVLTNLTNEARNENGLPVLLENSFLVKSAQAKAEDMAKKGYFAHTSPEGITPWYWLNKNGYKYSYAGENLAVNFFESADVAKAWMASPTHRANIVRKEFTEIGIATASGIYQGREAVFVVQFFGKPLVQKTKPILTEEITTQDKITEEKKLALETIKVDEINKSVVLGEEVVPENIIPTETVKTELTTTNEIKNDINKIVSSPRKTVNNIFVGIFSIVLLALVVFLWRTEKKHPEVILRSLALIFVVLILIVLNQKTLHIDTKLPDSSTANTIAS